MSPTPAHPRSAHQAVDGRVARAVRMLLALLLAIALPAQAISASVERVWNAAHYHRDDSGKRATVVANIALETRYVAVAEHYPLQRARAMASGGVSMPMSNDVHSPTQAAALDVPTLDAHAMAHRSGIAHHHDADTLDVVYVADADEQPMSAAERSGKHDHDGFSPANLVGNFSITPHHRRVLLTVAAQVCVNHLCEPGERPPR